MDSQIVISAIDRLHLQFLPDQSIQDRLGVTDKTIISNQIGYEMRYRASDITRDQVDDRTGCGCEPQNAQLMVDENSTDVRSRQ